MPEKMAAIFENDPKIGSTHVGAKHTCLT